MTTFRSIVSVALTATLALFMSCASKDSGRQAFNYDVDPATVGVTAERPVTIAHLLSHSSGYLAPRTTVRENVDFNKRFPLGFQVMGGNPSRKEVESMSSRAFRWGGAAGTEYVIDPDNDLVILYYISMWGKPDVYDDLIYKHSHNEKVSYFVPECNIRSVDAVLISSAAYS